MIINNNNLVFFQGRCFPENPNIYNKFPKKWRTEINQIKQIGFKFIDLIYDKENQLISKLDKVLFYCEKKKLIINSVIGDKFLKKKSIRKNNHLIINEIIEALKFFDKHRINSLTVPFIENNYVSYKDLKLILDEIYILIRNKNIKFYFEYNNSYEKLNNLLNNYNNKILLCYDIGNALEKKRNIYTDIIKFQKIIGHIHLKDKKLKNGKYLKCQFGAGNLDLKKLFQTFKIMKNKNIKMTFETFMGVNPYMNLKKNYTNTLSYLDLKFTDTGSKIISK